ncbi:MAG: alpha-L-glutamate ligase-like protein [Gammaproteobacteria bacterium]|nr:alpha-L-glutamate ligase-like protein [Gammaproteobacteria bacterium]MDH5239818.1 alpha-L-glutamate ligase-like protein [Gammaproteobacteria bacterium]MDH5261400.1 alpha-L-glutamate ligase-like protein [Gammaproteobacteria bacterium]MDH5584188.1 alpha-L-glutamate ligase-like protein [Gammaproteobacteria bacterium]
MISIARKLHEAGVLGLNERNADYIMRLNPRRFYPRVDDKVLTKKLAIAAGMAVPELYGVIEHQVEVKNFANIVAQQTSFVVKPAEGSGGDGILVVTGRSERKRDTFRLSSGVLMSEGEIQHHISNIVGGQYSLSGHRDKALIEYCVHFDPTFAEVSYQGVPDIRVIVYRGYPAMAMVRLPTRASDGKANLHQGAVGAGVNLATGMTLAGVLENKLVEDHPDTGAIVSGLQIPHWDFILETSARGYEVSGLGYLGVDMVIDADLGPLILEMNARPGLNIQIANREGIANRIRRIEEIYDAAATPAERAAAARREFPAKA